MPPRKVEPGTFHDLGVIDAPALGGGRRVRAYVPRGRHPNVPRPVLWLFDGQNVFHDDGSFAGGWHVHEAVDRLVPGERTIAPIVVGIDHGGVDRIHELGPFKMGDKGGRTDALLDWVVGTVVPLVRSRFPVVHGPVGGVVGGSSMGGLAAIYAHHRHPDVFGGALCLSPSFWFAGGAILRHVAEKPRPSISRVYLDCGTREGGGRMLPLVERMAGILAERGYPPEQLMLRADKRGIHNERHWRRRLPKALRFMFRT